MAWWVSLLDLARAEGRGTKWLCMCGKLFP